MRSKNIRQPYSRRGREMDEEICFQVEGVFSDNIGSVN